MIKRLHIYIEMNTYSYNQTEQCTVLVLLQNLYVSTIQII